MVSFNNGKLFQGRRSLMQDGRFALRAWASPDDFIGGIDMKKVLLSMFTLAILAGTFSSAEAQHRHRHCYYRHHHRVCRWS
jgi:hypothetical protein